MWLLTIGVVFTETLIYYRYTPLKSHLHFYYFLSIHPLLEIFPNLKFLSLIWLKAPFFPDWNIFSIP